jgi:prophage regulatory protein
MKTIKEPAATPAVIAPDALYSWKELRPFVKVGHETWRRRMKANTAPRPIPMGSRCTRWRGSDILMWLANPAAYIALPVPAQSV